MKKFIYRYLKLLFFIVLFNLTLVFFDYLGKGEIEALRMLLVVGLSMLLVENMSQEKRLDKLEGVKSK